VTSRKERKAGIANQRKLNQTIRKMEQVSQRILFRNRFQRNQRKLLRPRYLGLS
jgi:hypothetical protein